jgi:hypothetical protein
MVSQVGLLTPTAIDDGMLCEAERTYRLRLPSASVLEAAGRVAEDESASLLARRRARRRLEEAQKVSEAKQVFRAAHSYQGVRVAFLGVFDTVGALGVPGPSRRRSKFHDVSLASIVDRARQALAIDERRLTFAPCLWSVPDGDPEGRVEQVWFPGTHGDVGGGGARCGLSDLSLQWMADELAEAGVVLDRERLPHQLGTEIELVLCQAPPAAYKVLNVVKRLKPRYEMVDGRRTFRSGLRVLAEPGAAPGTWRDGVRLAGNAARYVVEDRYDQRAENLRWWLEEAGGVERVPIESVRAASEDRRPLVLT